MTCVKTGCHIYIIPYGLYAYGDAHQVPGESFFFRLVAAQPEPLSDVIHFEVNDMDSWWDRGNHEVPSTLICASSDVLSYGYNGRETSLFPHVQKDR